MINTCIYSQQLSQNAGKFKLQNIASLRNNGNV